MDKPSKRGKIPQSDWPLIMSRYEAGETLASIARTYDCSPPAISYVVSRSRAQQAEPVNVVKQPSTIEPQLIKASPNESGAAEVAKQPALTLTAPPIRTNGEGSAAPHAASPGASNGRSEEPPAEPQSNGRAHERDAAHPNPGQLPMAQRPNPAPWAPRPAAPPQPAPAAPAASPHAVLPLQANGDHRRTLHLSLGNPSHGNGSGHTNEAERANGANNRPQPSPAAPEPARNGLAADGITAPRAVQQGAPSRNDPEPRYHNKEGGKESGAFIDQELRSRVEGDIAAFLSAFDAALAQDTVESRSGLREATDRLLRAGARTRIELERLEARIPLPPRDNGVRSNPAWRDR